MNNQVLLAVVGVVIVVLIGLVLMDKYDACQAAQKNFAQCFQRYGRYR